MLGFLCYKFVIQAASDIHYKVNIDIITLPIVLNTKSRVLLIANRIIIHEKFYLKTEREGVFTEKDFAN